MWTSVVETIAMEEVIFGWQRIKSEEKNGPRGGLDWSNPCSRPQNTSLSRKLSVHTWGREKEHFVDDRK